MNRKIRVQKAIITEEIRCHLEQLPGKPKTSDPEESLTNDPGEPQTNQLVQ